MGVSMFATATGSATAPGEISEETTETVVVAVDVEDEE